MPPNVAPAGTNRVIYASVARPLAEKLALSSDSTPIEHLQILTKQIGDVRGNIALVTCGDIRAVLGRADQVSDVRPAILALLHEKKDGDLVKDLPGMGASASSTDNNPVSKSVSEDDVIDEPLPPKILAKVAPLAEAAIASFSAEPQAGEEKAVVRTCLNVCLGKKQTDAQIALYVIDAVFEHFTLKSSSALLSPLLLLVTTEQKLDASILERFTIG